MSCKSNEQPEGFGGDFEEESFWRAMRRGARRLGHAALEKVLLAYYVGIDPDTPEWARVALFAALGYFAFPVDAIPDVVPVVGYSDDVAVIAAALAAVATVVNDEHLRRARARMRWWGVGSDDGPDGDTVPAAA